MMSEKNVFPTRRSVMLGGLAVLLPLHNAHAGKLERHFSAHTPGGGPSFDHSKFDHLLQKYVVRTSDGISRVRYKAFKAADHGALRAYLTRLEQAPVHSMARPEQFAFWANLYNAKTLDIVLTHYPVKSIKKINLGGGFLSGGPWKKKLLKVAGTALSLDDIEHAILRPLWRDNRIHYALNCASIGCPNLGAKAYSVKELENQLDHAARAYINHPRGVSVKRGRITASKIYDWYGKDFGGRRGLPAHWRKYAETSLLAALDKDPKISGFAYDWRLNDLG